MIALGDGLPLICMLQRLVSARTQAFAGQGPGNIANFLRYYPHSYTALCSISLLSTSSQTIGLVALDGRAETTPDSLVQPFSSAPPVMIY